MDESNAMQDDVLLDQNEEFVAPEVSHVGLIFQALSDTVNNVAGTEGLTTPQMYFHGVLSAAGGLTHAQSVEGAEGFFANVKSGAKAAIAYIKKMFADIWGFFFKKKAPEEVKALKKEIAETKADFSSTEKVKTGLLRAAGDSKELGEKIKAASSMGDLNGLSKDVAKANARGQQALVVKVGQLKEALEDEIKLAGEIETQAKASGEADYTAWASGVKGSVAGTQALINAIKDIRDLNDISAAEATLGHLKTYADVMERSIETAAGTEARVKGRIDALGKLDDSTSLTDEQKKEGDKNLASLQVFMKTAARYSALLKRTLSHMKSVNTAVGKVFGV